MKSHKRLRVCADFQVQLGLAFRVSFYWIACQATIVSVVMGIYFLSGNHTESMSPWSLLVPALIVSGLVLPVALLDLLIFSNRFAGPIHRLRKYLACSAAGDSPGPLNFRQGDYYGDIAANLNSTLQKQESNHSFPDGGYACERTTEERVPAHF
ncbi:MAG: hypothetical protein R3C03_23325 [Pirellulaceae bacterium]